jgi:aminomethyltransferase
MKSTPFTDIHIALGARMHEFAGYNMPIEYPTRITEEHLTVCRSVGVFDVSHMGEIWVKGPKALELVQKVTSNDAASLPVGKVQYSCFPNENGGIVDDLLVYHYQPEKYMLVVNASNIEKDFNNLLKHNSSIGAELENASENTALLAVQGPNALHVLQKLFPIDLSTIPYYTFKTTSLEGIGEVIISNTGYTGAGGFEIYFYPDAGVELWNRIMQAGAEYGIKPIGLGARDTLRLEMGFCLYGNDIDDTTSPIEAGLGWITKFTEDNNFVARPVLEKQKAEGVQRKLVAFKMLEKRSPRHGQPIEDVEGETIGIVTSGS